MCQYTSAVPRKGSVTVTVRPGSITDYDQYLKNWDKEMHTKGVAVRGIGEKSVRERGSSSNRRS